MLLFASTRRCQSIVGTDRGSSRLPSRSSDQCAESSGRRHARQRSPVASRRVEPPDAMSLGCSLRHDGRHRRSVCPAPLRSPDQRVVAGQRPVGLAVKSVAVTLSVCRHRGRRSPHPYCCTSARRHPSPRSFHCRSAARGCELLGLSCGDWSNRHLTSGISLILAHTDRRIDANVGPEATPPRWRWVSRLRCRVIWVLVGSPRSRR